MQRPGGRQLEDERLHEARREEEPIGFAVFTVARALGG